MKKLITSLLLLLATASFASSCYDYANIKDKPNKPINTALFVLIDQTTLFNKDIKQQILINASSQINEGNLIYIARFSAFVNGYYNEKIFDLKMDYSLNSDQRYNIKKSKLKKLDKCLKDQENFVKYRINNTIKKVFLKKGEDIPKSDILFAFKDFSNVISETQAKRKIVLIASDMLENSIISSFYKSGTLRKISSKSELKKVEVEELFGDFGGAEIYIIGAGITHSNILTSTYKDPRKLLSLKDFWTQYFKKSNGELIEMGQPVLKKMIQ